MVFSDTVKRCLSPILIISLLAMLALTVTGCEDFEQWSPTPPPEPEEKTEVVEAPPIAIRTVDRAPLAVYEHLLTQAESYQAKAYLADLYPVSDNGRAESEIFKEGTSVWHVVGDMTSTEAWAERPYWQQASWLVFQDGKVMPSNRLKANALRIEADLQELSLQLKPLKDEGVGGSNGD